MYDVCIYVIEYRPVLYRSLCWILHRIWRYYSVQLSRSRHHMQALLMACKMFAPCNFAIRAGRLSAGLLSFPSMRFHILGHCHWFGPKDDNEWHFRKLGKTPCFSRHTFSVWQFCQLGRDSGPTNWFIRPFNFTLRQSAEYLKPAEDKFPAFYRQPLNLTTSQLFNLSTLQPFNLNHHIAFLATLLIETPSNLKCTKRRTSNTLTRYILYLTFISYWRCSVVQ